MSTAEWAALRALSVETIVEMLGVRREGEHYLCPRYPGCCALFVVHDDPEYGISVRCTRTGCILGPMDKNDSGFHWPEWALALHKNIPIDEARRWLLLAAARLARPGHVSKPSRDKAPSEIARQRPAERVAAGRDGARTRLRARYQGVPS